MTVYARSDGCISMGPNVTCDGFISDAVIRIQTHVHSDHMTDFDKSKGVQRKIISSQATVDLLIAELNADLPYRLGNQIICLPTDGSEHEVEKVKIGLFPSGHMLGSVMAMVEQLDGKRVLYTSDFNWPIPLIPQNIDVMIVDSTYGDPAQVRNYNETTVRNKLVELIRELIITDSLIITGYRGRLQYAIEMIAEHVRLPFVLSPSAYKEEPVYRKYNRSNISPIRFGSNEFSMLVGNGEKFVGFVDLRDQGMVNSDMGCAKILLSSFMVPRQEPILHHPNIKLTRIALTDHADFNGTISLINAIRPRQVIACGNNQGHAIALASYVSSVLGITSRADQEAKPLEW